MKLVSIGAIAVGSALLLALSPASAQELYNFLYRFPKDGFDPSGGVISDATGALYGVTAAGGAASHGTAYKLVPSTDGGKFWTESILWNFGSVPEDGQQPRGDLLMESTGAIFGATVDGGTQGYGTVFKLTPPSGGSGVWAESAIFSFGFSNGDGPGALIEDSNGNLYGTTVIGGDGAYSRVGTVFKLIPPVSGQTEWTEQVLYAFGATSTDGSNPDCKLVMDAKGNLYGTTEYGGSGSGTVFEVSPPASGTGAWTESIIYDFDGSTTGGNPLAGLALGPSGALYGTTSAGGSNGDGTVFALLPPAAAGASWHFHVLHTFTGSPDGATPYAALTLDKLGNLYGTTGFGGLVDCNNQGCGTVFELSPPPNYQGPWTESVYLPDTTVYGSNPGSDVIFGQGHALFGAASGGDTSGGVVYRLPK